MIRLLFGLLMMFICTTTGCISDDEPEGPSLKAGDSLPQFTVTMNNGEIISDSSLRGSVAVIVFFNTGCSDCQKELPVIQDLWEKYIGDSDVKILAIAREESTAEIEEYWQENGLTMPFSPQQNREIYNLFAYNVIPRIYIANTSGIITANFDDIEMPSLKKLIAEIDKARGEDLF